MSATCRHAASYGYAIKSRISPYRTSAREFAQTVRRFFVKDRG